MPIHPDGAPRRRRPGRAAACLLAAFAIGSSQPVLAAGTTSASSNEMEDGAPGHDETHAGMSHQDMSGTSTPHDGTGPTAASHDGMTHGDATHGDAMHGDTAGMHGMSMIGFFGHYPMMRESSGTSWAPDTTPHEGVHAMIGDWQVMTHALINGVYDRQNGPRGDTKLYAGGMLMVMAQRQLGEDTLGFRAMMSPDALAGQSGYPLLLATGETANGVSHLVDRQHPHDLFMELAATYSRQLTQNTSAFLYLGYPGEPALGPPAFMHRTSGMDNPEAPITHHWLDSTHITFGVVAAGLVLDRWKIEASAFKGREPDQYRFDFDEPKLDSFAGRLSWNPVDQLSMQVSYGHLHSPEQLDPLVNEDRITASAIYTQPFGTNDLWSTTFAWGRKMNHPGNDLDGFLLESAIILDKRWTIFARAERKFDDELFEDNPRNIPAPQLEGRVLLVDRVSVGAIYDFPVAEHLKVGIGGLVSKVGLPAEARPYYGGEPTSGTIFFRLKLS